MARKRRIKTIQPVYCKKKDYLEVQEAVRDARNLSIRDAGSKVDVFTCGNCGGTHVGHVHGKENGSIVLARFCRGENIL